MDKRYEYIINRKRKLPHYQPKEGFFFLTFGLFNSLPKSYFIELEEERKRLEIFLSKHPDEHEAKMIIHKKLFAFYDDTLNKTQNDLNISSDHKIAEILVESLQNYNDDLYNLVCYTIMPNHVHLLFQIKNDVNGLPFALSKIMMSIKGRSSRYINQYLNRTGHLWDKEYYDHFVRNDQEMNNIIRYILNNPVKAGLATDTSEWKWNWIAPGFIDRVNGR